MNFRRGLPQEEPDINLIPMIDVLLVILIFLLVSTSYAKYSQLKIDLPQANGEATDATQLKLIEIAVDANEHYAINEQPHTFKSLSDLSAALQSAAKDLEEPVIVIRADAKAPHQAVINIMEAARMANLTRITFTTQIEP